jgi:hypothetical protein
MESVGEHRICVKFYFKVGKPAAESHNTLHEAYSTDASSQITYEQFKSFKNGRTSMDDDEQPVRPSTSRSKLLRAQVKKIIHGNCRLTEKLQKRLEYPWVHATQF